MGFDADERGIVGTTMLGHAMVHTYELSIPVFIPIWLKAFGLTPAAMGVIVAAGYALFGLGALPGGIVADRYGSRRLILACLVGMGLAFIAVGAARTPLALAAALMVWGAAASVYHPAGLSLISRGVEARGTALGYHGMAGNVGIALGPLAVLLLLVAVDWRVAAALLAVPAGLAAVAVLATGFEEPADTGVGDPADDRGFSPAAFVADTRTLFAGAFVLVFGIVVLEGLFYRGALTFLPELLSDLSQFAPVTVGGRSLDPARYLYAGLLLVGVLGQYGGGWLVDRVPTERALVGLYVAITAVFLAFIPAARAGAMTLIAASALLGILLFGEQPVLQAAVAERSAAAVRGLSYGYMYIGVFGIGALGAAVTGVVLTYATPSVLFAVLGGFSLLGAVLAAAIWHRY